VIVVVLGIFICAVVLVVIFILQKVLRVPGGDVVYSDSEKRPGEVIRAKTVPLVGKPDFLVKKGKYMIPVELKRGKTPVTPYPNHVAQLYAYCVLVSEEYGVRPPYGIIKYPKDEFRLEFPEGVEDQVRVMVESILGKKNGELVRKGFGKICRKCREEHNVKN
jgi:CRISPR-associated exonuclease Cas4